MGLKDWFKKHTGEDLEDSLADALKDPVGELVELLVKGAVGELQQQLTKRALAANVPGLTPAMIDKLVPLLVAEIQKWIKTKARSK